MDAISVASRGTTLCPPESNPPEGRQQLSATPPEESDQDMSIGAFGTTTASQGNTDNITDQENVGPILHDAPNTEDNYTMHVTDSNSDNITHLNQAENVTLGSATKPGMDDVGDLEGFVNNSGVLNSDRNTEIYAKVEIENDTDYSTIGLPITTQRMREQFISTAEPGIDGFPSDMPETNKSMIEKNDTGAWYDNQTVISNTTHPDIKDSMLESSSKSMAYDSETTTTGMSTGEGVSLQTLEIDLDALRNETIKESDASFERAPLQNNNSSMDVHVIEKLSMLNESLENASMLNDNTEMVSMFNESLEKASMFNESTEIVSMFNESSMTNNLNEQVIQKTTESTSFTETTTSSTSKLSTNNLLSHSDNLPGAINGVNNVAIEQTTFQPDYELTKALQDFSLLDILRGKVRNDVGNHTNSSKHAFVDQNSKMSSASDSELASKNSRQMASVADCLQTRSCANGGTLVTTGTGEELKRHCRCVGGFYGVRCEKGKALFVFDAQKISQIPILKEKGANPGILVSHFNNRW